MNNWNVCSLSFSITNGLHILMFLTLYSVLSLFYNEIDVDLHLLYYLNLSSKMCSFSLKTFMLRPCPSLMCYSTMWAFFKTTWTIICVFPPAFLFFSVRPSVRPSVRSGLFITAGTFFRCSAPSYSRPLSRPLSLSPSCARGRGRLHSFLIRHRRRRHPF